MKQLGKPLWAADPSKSVLHVVQWLAWCNTKPADRGSILSQKNIVIHGLPYSDPGFTVEAMSQFNSKAAIPIQSE